MKGKILGDCRILRLIGKGGMGAVYEGFHVGLEKKVAVKVLPPRMADQEEFLKRFLREAKAAAKLEHPHIVQVMNVGHEEGNYFIIMQLVEGESLGQRVEREEALPVDEACRFIHQTASALEFAHKKGITHRDVKPDNLLIGEDGLIKVTDFGLAGHIDQRSSITTPDKILGTPYFMSPEQCRGDVANERSDIYSLGATFYYLLTGTYPFQGDSAMATLMKHINDPLIPPDRVVDDLDPKISRLVERMMEKDPRHRPEYMEEVQKAIVEVRGESVLGLHPPLPPPRRVSSTAVLAGAAVFTAGVVALLLVLLAPGEGPSEAAGAFREAEAYSREHPSWLLEISRKYRQVAKAHPDTPEGRAARKAAESYSREAKDALRKDEAAASSRAEALYRKGEFTAAAGVLDEFAKSAPKGTAFGERFRALRAASVAIAGARDFWADLHFTEAAGLLAEFPANLAETEFGRDVMSWEKSSRAKAEVLERAGTFARLMKQERVDALLRFLSKKRHPTEGELLVTSGRIIASELDILEMAVSEVTGRNRRIDVRFSGRVKLKGSDGPRPMNQTTTWIRESGTWVMEGEGKGERWIEMAVKLRIGDLVAAVNRGDEAGIRRFLKIPRGSPRIWEMLVKKWMWDLRKMSRIAKIKEMKLDTFRVDYRDGTVYTAGTPILIAGKGEKRSGKPFEITWLADEGTFKIRLIKEKKKNK